MATRVQHAPTQGGVGPVLRDWRRRRHLSQLALALEAGISQRHLSFIESGRAQPSREMLLQIAEALGVPLRARNGLLLAAGYAPTFAERPLLDPALDAARRAVERVLRGHEPYPAVAIDRHWTLLFANNAASTLLEGIAPPLLEPPLNVLRLSLHPDGLAPRILNYHEWRRHILDRLQHQAESTADAELDELIAELKGYPAPVSRRGPSVGLDGAGVFVPLQIATPLGVLSLISTTTVFSGPMDVTLAEIVLECFFPADRATADRLSSAGGRLSP